ncbi:MAG: hypothetical protein MUF20_11575 [Methylotetracoccus sp.]|nr:hypothetical protein [Methylotetracoccus sp.]
MALEPAPVAILLPVVMTPARAVATEPTSMTATALVSTDALPSPVEPGQIEIAVGRTWIRVTGSVGPTLLDIILTHVQQR